MIKRASLLALFIAAAPALGADLVWDCPSHSDPDNTNVKIYSYPNGRLVATLAEQSGDGDFYNQDIIEVKRDDKGSDAVLTYVQVDGSRVSDKSLVKKATHKTQGAVITFSPNTDRDGSVTAKVGPDGEKLTDEGLSCTSARE